MADSIKIAVSPLRIPLRTSFKQASSIRNTGESIWVKASRGEIIGYGESCPRPYVTGETIASCMKWITDRKENIVGSCTDFKALKKRLSQDQAEIDKNPAAWCALETALLDLFAREKNCSVERLLGLEDPSIRFQYTAVIGDGSQDQFEKLLSQYLKWGLSDFKIKVNGNLEKDLMKLISLKTLCKNANLEK